MKNFTVELPTIPEREYNIKDFGAVNGGTKSNTEEINAAISTANAEGGGKIIIPAGIWLTGPITLKSNINLHLETGAVLLFDKKRKNIPFICQILREWSVYVQSHQLLRKMRQT